MKRTILALLITLVLMGMAMPARASSAYVTEVLGIQSANLIAYWPLNEVSGLTAYDLSAAARNGTYNGPVLNRLDGPEGSTGQVPLFDGTNDTITFVSSQFSGIANNDAGTWAVWIYPSNNPTLNMQAFVSADAGNVQLIQMYMSPNTQICIVGVNNQTNNVSCPWNQWTHITVSWQRPGNRKTYVNGILVSTFTQTNTGGTPVSFRMGGNMSGSWFWNGYIGHLAWWNVQLTDAEVLELSSATTYAPTGTPTSSPTPTASAKYFGTLASGQAYELDYSVTGGDAMITFILLVILAVMVFALVLQVQGRRRG